MHLLLDMSSQKSIKSPLYLQTKCTKLSTWIRCPVVSTPPCFSYSHTPSPNNLLWTYENYKTIVLEISLTKNLRWSCVRRRHSNMIPTIKIKVASSNSQVLSQRTENGGFILPNPPAKWPLRNGKATPVTSPERGSMFLTFKHDNYNHNE